ncbi:endonuclease/exonuclease/phosphatase family protein [Streptomyces sp. NPDC050619]|uniref:endonuclease/exonuclease/phosphatase family protein n=1 Tax=Streptomyces sp. NPDC050619 TaxID=3157214 RepID=UPI003440AC02
MRTIRLANLNAYKLQLNARGRTEWNARVTAVRELAPGFLGLQEVVVDEATTPRDQWDAIAAQTITAFAEDCGLTATIPATPGHPHGAAMAANAHRAWYTAVLWNPHAAGFVPGSYRPYGALDFWHGFTTAGFDLGNGEPVLVASYQGHPINKDVRLGEAWRIKSIYRTTGGAKPGFVMGDFNALSAAQVLGLDGQLRYYDDETYRDQDHDDLEYQVLEGTIGDEQLADRRQTAALLRRGFMVDAAAHLMLPWHATTGHWKDGQGDPDPWGERRIDLILATRPVAPALTAYGVHDSKAARAGSDHLMPWVDLNPAKITAEETGR